MSVNIKSVDKAALTTAVLGELSLSEDEKLTMFHGIKISHQIFIGRVDEGIACIWGIVSPTLLSTRCGIWTYTTDLIEEHPFVFVRHSQMVIQKLLEEFETIEGTTNKRAEHSKRWLRWLGATFEGESDGDQIKFVIRRKYNG